ncbi:MAG TPA: DUF4386 domain-containing protein [Gemmatimonadaceae bacterium]|nr:DUF4386 domain-containing protein [Gemmatimonadaceae bacterium]
MTRDTNARVAGATFLVYIAVAFPAMVLSNSATAGTTIAERLASIAHHATAMRVTIVLDILSCFCALVLASTLYGITRDEDRELALLAFASRVGEGLLAAFPFATLGLLWLGTKARASAADASAIELATYLFKIEASQTISASLLFAAGSTLFSYLLLRGRMIPRPLAWLGVLGSAVLVVLLPLELAGFIAGASTQLAWIPLVVFELTLAGWLLVKGIAPSPLPTRPSSAPAAIP